MKKMYICIIIFFFILSIHSESLWVDEAADIYSKKINYSIGDTIEIRINESSHYEYKATSNALKSFEVAIEGGELKDIFDFLPVADVNENKSIQDSDSFEYQAVMQAGITDISGRILSVQGRKQFQINNKSGTIELSGEASISDIVDNSITSSKLLNPRLRIITLLDNQNTVITGTDIITKILNPDTTGDVIEEEDISEEKKKELILYVFNKILNVIF